MQRGGKLKKTLLKLFGIWIIGSLFIIIIIFSHKIRKEKEIKESFYATAKLISKQRVDAGLRVLSSFYAQKEQNEREKFLLIDYIIRKFNINNNFNYKNIYVDFTIKKSFSPEYIFYEDVINENKIVYIYENINKIKQKIYSLIATLFDAFRFGKKGYIFIYDDKGNCYYHYDKKFIGKNRWNLKRNGIYVLQLITKKAKEHPNGVYVKYLAFNPNGKPTEKISYVVYFPPLHLILGSGVYLKDLQHKLDTFSKELEKMFFQAEASLTFILFLTFLLIRRRTN